MTLKEAIKSSLIILKQVMEEKLNATNIEVFFFSVVFYSDTVAPIGEDWMDGDNHIFVCSALQKLLLSFE